MLLTKEQRKAGWYFGGCNDGNVKHYYLKYKKDIVWVWPERKPATWEVESLMGHLYKVLTWKPTEAPETPDEKVFSPKEVRELVALFDRVVGTVHESTVMWNEMFKVVENQWEDITENGKKLDLLNKKVDDGMTSLQKAMWEMVDGNGKKLDFLANEVIAQGNAITLNNKMWESLVVVLDRITERQIANKTIGIQNAKRLDENGKKLDRIIDGLFKKPAPGKGR